MELNWKSAAAAAALAAAPAVALADHTCKELTVPVTGADGKVTQKGTGNYNCSAWLSDDINLITQRRTTVVTRKGKVTKGGVEQQSWEDEIATDDTLKTAQAGGRGLIPSALGALWTISGIKLNVNIGNAASRESKAYERGVDNGAFKSTNTTNYNCEYYGDVTTTYAGNTGCASATGGASTGAVVGGGTGGNSGYTTAITGGTASGAFSSQQNASGGSGVNTGTDGTVNTGTSLPTKPISSYSFGAPKLGALTK